MKRWYSLVLVPGMILAMVAGRGPAAGVEASPQSSAGGDWVSLFDGKSLQGWRAYKRPDATGTRWKVEDGTLTLPPSDGKDTRGARDIVTVDTFDRFELTWEWRISPGGNSGVKYYVLEDQDSAIGHEYQIIDDERHADAKVSLERQTAAFYDVLPPANRKIKPAGEWNESRIVARGPAVEHYLNGGKVLTYELESPALKKAILDSKFDKVERFGKLHRGHILLQDHGDQVWYRNIRIRRLAGQS